MSKQSTTRTRSKSLCRTDSFSSMRCLMVIIALQIVLSVVYWVHTPLGAPPDEGPHWKYVRDIVKTGSLPVFDAADRANYERHQPPLYYVLGVPFYVIGEKVGMESPGEMVRLLSLVLSVLVTLVVYRAVSVFTTVHGLPVACAAFVALLPTHVMLGSSVSNDLMVELAFGVMLLVVSSMLANGMNWRRTLALGAVLGIGLLSKTTCVLMYPVVCLGFLLLLERKRARVVTVVSHLSAAVGVSLVIGGWWLVRNQVLYGDPLALTQFRQAFEHTATPKFWYDRGFTPGMYLFLVLGWTIRSFWGVFGHMSVWMPMWLYHALTFISFIVYTTSITVIFKLRKESPVHRDMILVYITVIGIVCAAFVKFNTIYFQAQGRYLYPALIPLSLFWALGTARLIPLKYRHLTPFVIMGLMMVVQAIALATCIIPLMPEYQMPTFVASR